jgi:hypothetical protein
LNSKLNQIEKYQQIQTCWNYAVRKKKVIKISEESMLDLQDNIQQNYTDTSSEGGGIKKQNCI